jgi:hypothetical protein
MCGLDLPLDKSFDFMAWRKTPPDMAIPDDMLLQEWNQYNYDTEMHKMVDNPELCTLILAPIPPTLYSFILNTYRTKAKAKEAKKEAKKQVKNKPSKLTV